MRKILTLLLLAVFIKELAWSSFLPLWQSPDEQAHYGQVNLLTQTGKKHQLWNNSSEEIFFSEKILGTNRDSAGNNHYTYHPQFNIPYSNSTIGVNEYKIINLSANTRKEMVIDEGTGYPFLYYSVASLVDGLLQFGSLFDRVFAIRILSDLSLVGIVYFAYLSGKLIFKNERKSILLGCLVGFQPMVGFVHSGVTSDVLFNLFFSAFFYFSAKLIANGLNVKTIFLLAITLWLSFMTKQQANIMLFILIPELAVLVYLKLSKIDKIAKHLPIYLLSVMATSGVCAGLILKKIDLSAFLPNSELTFIDPNITIIEHIRFTLFHTFREVLPWYWGVFRWLSLGLPDILRKITTWSTILSFIGFSIFLARKIFQKEIDRVLGLKLFALFACIIYFCAISAFDFSFRRSHSFSFGIQGRYFFPIIVPQMIIFVVGLEIFIPKIFHSIFEKILFIGMILLSLVTFFWVMGSYYQLSFPTFFIQASQYKPVWLKYSTNLVILFSYLIMSMALSISILFQNEKNESYKK